MKNLIRVLVLGSLVLIFSFSVSAQRATRVNFARGATSAVVTGTLNGYKDRKVFVIRVRRGQTLKTAQILGRNSNRYITVFVTDPNGDDASDSDASCNNRKEVSPTAKGDYRLEVVECMKADRWRGTFRLRVTVL